MPLCCWAVAPIYYPWLETGGEESLGAGSTAAAAASVARLDSARSLVPEAPADQLPYEPVRRSAAVAACRFQSAMRCIEG